MSDVVAVEHKRMAEHALTLLDGYEFEQEAPPTRPSPNEQFYQAGWNALSGIRFG